LLSAIGAVDVGAQKLELPFTAMTSEAIAALNPEVIFVMTKGLASTGGVDGLVTLPGVAQTDAGKSRRIIAVDDSLLLSFGPRTPNLILQMSNALSKVMKS
jgi:iron complex transport system substrate-binding protein